VVQDRDSDLQRGQGYVLRRRSFGLLLGMWHVLGRKTVRMITVLMGAPGSGKTTWVNNYAMDELILSTEAIRVMRDEIDAGAFITDCA